MNMEDLQALKAQIEALPPHERLVLAGGMLERAINEADPRRKLMLTRTAHVIAERVSTELGAALALHQVKAGANG